MTATPPAVASRGPVGGDLASDPLLARRASGLLADFHAGGVVSAADVHVAARIARLTGETDPAVGVAVALTVRGLRLGHVCVDVGRAARTVTVDDDRGVDPADLAWPDPDLWRDRLAASPAVAVGDDAPTGRPLRLVGRLLYLDRYWRQERLVAADLLSRADGAPVVDDERLRSDLDRLFGPAAGPGGAAGGPDLQRVAAAAAVLSRFAVIAGGPGTGKTTTVARLLALVEGQHTAAGLAPPRVALAAPTGRAASRLGEAVRQEAAVIDVDAAVATRLATTGASTIHRLLGWRPDSASRFLHDRRNRLPHDVVVVDESSMVSLSLMAGLVDALRPDARLVLVGDPEQLASVEAGAVLGDIVGPARGGGGVRPAARRRLEAATGVRAGPDTSSPLGSALGDGIVVLQRVHRFGGGIGALAAAIASGDEDRTLEVLAAGTGGVRWLQEGAGDATVRDEVVTAGVRVVGAARHGDGAAALAALGSLRVLCAHRRGPGGVADANDRIESWLAAAVDGYGVPDPWYPGRPLLVTVNDADLGLHNGDSGVVCTGDGGGPVAVFERADGLVRVPPARLGAVETLHAMTIHKSQGSQFAGVVVVLPPAVSPILTRELLYTAVTRAVQRVTVIGAPEVVAAAVASPITRASGLRARLWGDDSAGAG